MGGVHSTTVLVRVILLVPKVYHRIRSEDREIFPCLVSQIIKSPFPHQINTENSQYDSKKKIKLTLVFPLGDINRKQKFAIVIPLVDVGEYEGEDILLITQI